MHDDEWYNFISMLPCNRAVTRRTLGAIDQARSPIAPQDSREPSAPLSLNHGISGIYTLEFTIPISLLRPARGDAGAAAAGRQRLAHHAQRPPVSDQRLL